MTLPHVARRPGLRLAAAVCCLLGGGPVWPWSAAKKAAWAVPPEADAAMCERAGAAAELARGLPAGLLLAIGRVESGRWDAVRARTAPWPWTINAAGKGQWFETADDAIRSVRTLLDGGTRSIDVGCFQVNLMYHPAAFATLEQGFDPATNAAYAATFLASLQARTGSWESAVETYHSSNSARGFAYRQQVYATWLGRLQEEATPAVQGPSSRSPMFAQAPVPNRGPSPVRVGMAQSVTRFTVAGTNAPLPSVLSMERPFAGVRVLTPMPAGRAPRIVAMPPTAMTNSRITPNG